MCASDLPGPTGTLRRPTCLEELDGLGLLVRLLEALLADVVVDLLLRGQGLESGQDPAGELGHVGGAGGARVGQRHVDHENVRQHAGGEGERAGEDETAAKKAKNYCRDPLLLL